MPAPATIGFPASKTKQAKEWLVLALADGKQRAAGELLAEAAEAGVSARTLQRASVGLVKKTPARNAATGKSEAWLWSLEPAKRKPGPKTARRQ